MDACTSSLKADLGPGHQKRGPQNLDLWVGEYTHGDDCVVSGFYPMPPPFPPNLPIGGLGLRHLVLLISARR